MNSHLENVDKGTQINAQDIQNLARATADSFGMAFSQMNEIKIDLDQTKVLTNLLVKEAMIISTQGFEANKNILRLEKEMRDLESKGNLEGALSKVNELKQAMQGEQDKRQRFDQNLRGIAGGLEIVSGIANLIDPKIGRIVATVGQSVLTVGTSIATLAGLGTAAAGMTGGLAVLGPVGAIAGAVFAVINLFLNSGPSTDELILEAVKQLHESLNKFSKEVHERFDHLEAMIIAHHKFTGQYFEHLDKSMHKRFDHLLEVMGKFQEMNLQNFMDLKNVAGEIKAIALQLKGQIDTIELKIDQNFREIYATNYNNGRLYTLQYHERFPYPQTMPTNELNQHYSTFADWAIKGVKNSLLTGSTANNDAKKVANVVKNQGIDSQIQCLAAVAATLDPKLNKFGSLPNPFLWVNGVDTFLEFLFRLPEFKVRESHRRDFQAIRETGANFQAFVKALQSSPEVYRKLIDAYQNGLKKVQDIIKNKMVMDNLHRVKDNTLNWEVLPQRVNSVTLRNLEAESDKLLSEFQPFSGNLQEIVNSLAHFNDHSLEEFINVHVSHRTDLYKIFKDRTGVLVDKTLSAIDVAVMPHSHFSIYGRPQADQEEGVI